MYCLEKFQRELAYFLDIDLRDLPKVQEILQSQGYTAVKKNDEIIELGNGLQNLRDELTTNLTPILNKDITNISSGITAQVSKTSIKKMGSDKAVNKSIENGFSLQQHFKASADIENLYKNATKKVTTKDLKNGDPAIQIHTFISQVNDNANAKILVKESLDKDLRRIYTLELESLESTKPLAQVPNGDLADHLTKSKQKSDTSLTPLENVKGHYITKSQSKKNDEIIELGNGKVSKEQVEKLKEVVEKPTPKVDNAEVLQINADEAITKLHSTQGQPIPQEIDIQTFKNVLESIENQDNFITHLQKKQDAQSRLAYLNLVEPTLKEWDIKLTKGDRKELIKVFNDGDNFFTLLITEQDNKRLITFIPKARDGYIESKIKNADLIQTFTSRASESKAEWTRVANSTTNNLKWQQDGNVLRSVVELDNGEKLLLSKDRLENVYIQSNHIEQVNSYDELILQESLEKSAKDELENKLARQIESYRDTSPMAQYDKVDSSKQIESVSQFGENYPQFYHKAHEAIQHLLHTKSGQVQGAFYRKELGDIDLVWGEVTDFEKHKGYGLAHILDKHPEFDVFNIPKVIEQGKIEKTYNGYNIVTDDYIVGLNKGFKDKEGNIINDSNVWVVTSFEPQAKLKKGASSIASVTSNYIEPMPQKPDNIIPQTTQEIIKQAKASGKSVAETKELIQKNKELESTPQNTITQTLKDELKAADTTQKVAIVTREIEKQNEVLLKQYKELQDIVKNKDYTSLEIQEALDYIATNKKFETDTSIVVYNPIDSKDRGVYITKAAPQDERAKQFLKWKYTHLEQKPLMDIIKKNKSDMSKLKWDLEFIKNESNKMRLEKNLARLEKSLLKEEQEYLKSLSLTYDLNTQEGLEKTRDLFFRAKPTQEQIELFESILPVAKKLGVEVRNAIRDPYQVGGNTRNKSGTYFLKENSARVKHSISQADKSETLLHELIHSVTSRAMYAKEKGATHLLNREQIQAIDNIESIYKQIVEKKDELGFTSWNDREKTGDYGLKNAHEMIAELSNPKFASKLKKANVFEKIIDNIIQLFVSVAEMAGLKKSNAYDKLRENVKNIIENYKDDFSQEYEKLGVRNVGLEKWELAINFNAPMKEIKPQMLVALKPTFNQTMTSSDGIQAYMSLKSLSKMTSPQAIQKSIDNGFSREEHLKAVLDIERLFKNAKLQATEPHKSGETNAIIHRLNSELENGNALITTKESLDTNKNRVYSLELELTPRFNNSSTPLNTKISEGSFNSQKGHQEQTIKAEPSIAKTDTDIIPQTTQEIIKQAKASGKSVAETKELIQKHKEIESKQTNQKDPITKQQLDQFQILQEAQRAYDKLTTIKYANKDIQKLKESLEQAIKANDKELIKDKQAQIIKEEKLLAKIQQEANEELQELKELGISLENPLNLKTTPMPDTKRAEVKAIYEKYMPNIESITKQIENAKTQKQKDKLYKQRADITHKANNEMNAFLNDFDQVKQALMRGNLFAEKDEIKALKEADFDFENPFSFHNVDKTRYKQSWGSVDTKEKEYTRKLIQTRLLFDRFDPIIRWHIKGKIYNIDSFSKGIKDDEVLALPGDLKSIREDIEILYDIKPIKEFGTNYAEHYHSGESAIAKLLQEKQGQVSGAFYRKELGDIDLVWGNSDIGLQKIVEKHLKDFADFAGNNPYEKMSNAINEIIQNGKLLTENGVNTLWYKKGDEYYLVGISKGFNQQGDNNWVITSYKKDNITDLQKEKVDKLFSSDAEVLSAQGKFNELETLNSTTSDIIPQETLESTMQKFNYDEKKAKDLLE